VDERRESKNNRSWKNKRDDANQQTKSTQINNGHFTVIRNLVAWPYGQGARSGSLSFFSFFSY
jgi:hypothetical protein